MSKRDDFQKSMDENLALWAARLAALRAKASSERSEEKKAAELKKIAGWQTHEDAVASKLEILKNTQGDRWDVLKLEMTKAWQELDGLMGQAEEAGRGRDDGAKPGSSPTPAATPAA